MIHSCSVCGESFSLEQLQDAKANGGFIVCKYCGEPTAVEESSRTRTASGYELLGQGEFARASNQFRRAIDDAKRHGKTPSADTYIGMALSEFHVQTIFSEEKEGELPELVCHSRNEIFFADSNEYICAKEIITRRADSEGERKLDHYASFVDGVKDAYDKIESQMGKDYRYSVFIAYEDESQDEGNNGYEEAFKIRNNLPDRMVKNAFVPDKNEYGDDKEYEAAILYAIDHSNSMLVVADNSIDARLTDIYTRFYYKSIEESREGRNLGFVLYRGNIIISLPDDSIAERVFRVGDKKSYNDFVLTCNGVVIPTNMQTPIPTPPQKHNQATFVVPEKKWYRMAPSRKQIWFGSYPQKLVNEDALIVDRFEALIKPEFMGDDNGWTPMFFMNNGVAYTWYRDEMIGGKKYRGVYFVKFRGVYSVQKTDVKPKDQRIHAYMPGKVYCFSFEDIVWDVENFSGNVATLVSSVGLDSRELNGKGLDNNWDASTLRFWLNTTFIKDAFGEDEKYLCYEGGDFDDDKVFLMDKESSLDKKYYTTMHPVFAGSDYFRCIGGMGDNRSSNISSCWIRDCSCCDGKEAPVLSSLMGLSKMYVDCTSVAVVPKVYLKLN